MSDMTPRQKLIALRDALRAPMPEGFRWNYRITGLRKKGFRLVGAGPYGCAINLAVKLQLATLAELDDDNDREPLSVAFGVPVESVRRVFVHAGKEIGKANREVLPTDVADVIDRVLAETPNV